MKRLLFILILLPLYGKSQDSPENQWGLQLILLNSLDNSLIAYALTTDDQFVLHPDCVDSNNLVILDSILNKGYRFEYDHAYFRKIFDPDSAYAKPFVRYISCSDVGDFLRKSNIRFYKLHYGYMGLTHYDELAAKYGVVFENMGCVYDSSFTSYETAVSKLLELRNGAGWYSNYLADYNRLSQKK